LFLCCWLALFVSLTGETPAAVGTGAKKSRFFKKNRAAAQPIPYKRVT
jgi:hypothetical protein